MKFKSKQIIKLSLTTIIILLTNSLFSQTKTIVGIMPFNKSSNSSSSYYDRRNSDNTYLVAIQDAVSDAFLKAKRFTLVEREKMELIRDEKKTQKSEDYIDGLTVEQSKAMGASYIVTGNVTEASFEEKQSTTPSFGGFGGVSIPNRKAKISFGIKVIDVATGEIMASEIFSDEAKGKNAFDDALEKIKPSIEKFIKENFKLNTTLVSIEEKNSSNEAIKVLISGGTAIGLKPKTILKVYEVTTLVVEGKNIPRKKEIGKIEIEKVEDENFSICKVLLGGNLITTKSEAGASLRCEIISE